MSHQHKAQREDGEVAGPTAVTAGKRSLIASRYPALAQALGDRSSGAGEPTIHDAATAAVEHKGGGAAVDPAVAERVGAHLGGDFSGVRVHSDPLTQQATAALDGLRVRGDRSVCASLAPLAHHNNTEVRYVWVSASAALGCLDTAALRALATSDPDPDVKKLAAKLAGSP